MRRLIFNCFILSSLTLSLGCDGGTDTGGQEALQQGSPETSLSSPEKENWYDLEEGQSMPVGGSIDQTAAFNLQRNTQVLRSEYTECRSEIENPTTSFYNIGSLCADGLFSLIEGRGCENIAYDKTEGGWTYHYCNDTPTCDRLHEGMFLTIPTDISPPQEILEGYEMWCADSGYTVFYTPEKEARDSAIVHHVADGAAASQSD
jgi:hypothetical protein